jgi:uncharacterized protein YbjT (DUF2867 family)
MAQEKLIKSFGVPFTIVRATQFFEFIGAITEAGSANGAVRMTSAEIQPIAADDVAAALVDVALAKPVNRMIEVAGPEPFQMDELVRRYLAGQSDRPKVITDDNAPYFGYTLNRQTLLPGPGARLAPTHLADWLRNSAPQPLPMVR